MKAYSNILTRRTVLFLVAALFYAGCGGDAAAPPEEADQQAESVARRTIRVETLVVRPSTFEDVIELTGTVDAVNDAMLSAQSVGSLIYRVERGAYVPRGGVVARIDSTLLYASYQQAMAQRDVAKAQFELASDTYERQEPLYRDSIISATEYERVRAQLNQSEGQLRQAVAALAQLREQLDNTRVVAPFGGTVEQYMAEIGEQVMTGGPVARMVNTNAVKVTAGVPERYASDIEAGTRVRVSFAQYGGEQYEAEVRFVGSAIDPATRTFPIELRLDNSDRSLKPEMSARLFVTRDAMTEALVIPQDAVLLDEAGYGAFVVVREGGESVARRRTLDVGASYSGSAVVRAGIETGDEVVVVGQQNLTDGDLVEVVTRSESATARLTSTR